MIQSTAILGTGGWGSALACLWSQGGREIILWGHTPERVDKISRTRQNPEFLPGINLPSSVRLTTDLAACATAQLIVFVTPSTSVRSVARELCKAEVREDALLLSCTKGIEHQTGLRMSEIMRGYFPDHAIAVLSGPNLAAEVANRLPTAAALGCRDEAVAEQLQESFGDPHFRIYTTPDVAGVELGGALKNIFAIAAGVSDGFGFGDNSKAALITRSFAELIRLGVAMGGGPRTFHGLSGIGDLIATCFSPLSRNRRVGEQLGRGKSLREITAMSRSVAEGIPTSRSAFECARRLGVETPVIDQVFAILHEGKSPADAIRDLLARDQKSEGT